MTRKDPKHLDAIRQLPCCVCGEDMSDRHRAAHHLLRNVSRGMGMRAPDSATVSLCDFHHRQLHDCGDETTFFNEHGIADPVGLAAALYAASPDYGKMLDVMWRFKG